MKNILVCEDESVIREFVVINLQRAGYHIVDVSSGEQALEVFTEQKQQFDIALLDIMMPGMDGLTVCKIMRQKNPSMGIIMLSAKTQEMDKVNALMIGADDYITKPFSPSELVARVEAIHRRVCITTTLYQQPTLTSGPFSLSKSSRELTKNGLLVDLTQVEYQIIEMFLSNKNIALEREQILHTIWGEKYDGDVKIVDVNIRRLRIKVEEEPSKPIYIQTIWGFGYKWNDLHTLSSSSPMF